MRHTINVWKARVNWEHGEVDVRPNWRFALPAWIIPSLIGELFIHLLGGYLIGIIAGVGVSLVKSYYDFYLLMREYIPPLKRRKKVLHIFFSR